ncbi:FadR/GntR family transcriptional regulator [Erythrobacter sp. F6033]|uniref:FadR/GntR family transcriptional regulator n=1 Tax=Erythrobacter sp. F6033 TaxID=2926401 RepID=UPI001FF2450C|nr:FadR/GntR family transcriptional regulator [Erythrobacter sp. F6033]MCK0129287.1 FadR family transcriptional regulator [Erythrobacter sp. F6033]
MSELVYYDLKDTANVRLSLPAQMAREMGRRIVAGTFEPGELIDDENSLAERYSVSRVVVREAVKILVEKGMLSVRRGVGTHVRTRNNWKLLDDDVMAWHLSAPPRRDFLAQLAEIRLAIEPKAARWAAERATEEDIQSIQLACDRMAEEQGSTERFIIADALFHKAILRAAHNEFLAAIEGVTYSALLISVRITNKDPRENGASIPFHRDLANAIEERDPDKAEKLTSKLLEDAVRRLRLELGEDPVL